MHILRKIDNTWGKASELQDAFREFQTSWQNFSASAEVEAWFQDWGAKMHEPDLTQVMDYEVALPKVGLRTSVRDAARVMKDLRQTAVLVFDNEQYAVCRDLALLIFQGIGWNLHHQGHLLARARTE